MKVVRDEFKVAAKPSKRKAPRHKTTRDCPRVTLRLSPDDHERLKELAGSMALSTYIRAKALGLDLPRRKALFHCLGGGQAGYRANPGFAGAITHCQQSQPACLSCQCRLVGDGRRNRCPDFESA